MKNPVDIFMITKKSITKDRKSMMYKKSKKNLMYFCNQNKKCGVILTKPIKTYTTWKHFSEY